MKYLIDKEVLNNRLAFFVVPPDIWEAIQHMPTVDAAPVKHGRWGRAYLDHVAMGERPSVFYCSVCGQCIAYPVNYCPNCGADMRGEQDE